MNQVVWNIQEGMSHVPTGEDALNECYDMLHRMWEPVIQAADDTRAAADRF